MISCFWHMYQCIDFSLLIAGLLVQNRSLFFYESDATHGSDVLQSNLGMHRLVRPCHQCHCSMVCGGSLISQLHGIPWDFYPFMMALNYIVESLSKICKVRLILTPVLLLRDPGGEIGRASCRERVEIPVVAVSIKKKKKNRETAFFNFQKFEEALRGSRATQDKKKWSSNSQM